MTFSNLWKHPRTSAAGVLISLATVAGVLSQHGVSLGSAGSGTMVSLAGALATALLGVLARDPAQPAAQCTPSNCNASCGSGQSSNTAKLSIWLLIVFLIPLPWMEGCNGSAVAQDIVNWTPALQSAVATVDSTAALLAPADAPAFASATGGFDAASNLLVSQAKTYLANPTTGALTQLQTQVVALQQQVNAALLSAARIVDPASQSHALSVLQAVATIVTAILALVQSISSKTAVAKMAADSTIKLAAVRPYIDASTSAQLVAAHYQMPIHEAQVQLAHAEQAQIEAGL